MKAHKICAVDDLPPGRRIIVELDGRQIAVINWKQKFYAVRNRCAHQGGPVGEGPITRTVIATNMSDWEPELAFGRGVLRCPWHGLEYDLTTGKAIGIPRWRVRVYETRVKDGFIEVIA